MGNWEVFKKEHFRVMDKVGSIVNIRHKNAGIVDSVKQEKAQALIERAKK